MYILVTYGLQIQKGIVFSDPFFNPPLPPPHSRSLEFNSPPPHAEAKSSLIRLNSLVRELEHSYFAYPSWCGGVETVKGS